MSSSSSPIIDIELSGFVASIQEASLERYTFELISTPPNPDFNAIPVMFEPFLQLPDPQYYTPHIDQLDNAMASLQTGASSDPFDRNYTTAPFPVVQPGLSSLLQAGDATPEWQGTAADNFRTNFLNKFNTWVPNDYTLVAMMKATLEAHQATFQAAQHDIMNIAAAGLYAMNNYGGPSTGSSLPMALTVVSAITGLITAPIGGEVAVGAVLSIAVVGTAASIGAAATQTSPEPSPPPNALSAQWAYQVIGNIKSAITSLSTQIDNNPAEIGTALSQTLSTLSDPTVVRDYFEAPRPNLTGLTSDT